MTISGKSSRDAVWGLFSQRTRWGFSKRGWLLAIAIVAATAFGVFSSIYQFFAINAPTQADVLAVEGWVHPYAIQAAVEEYSRGHYRHVFATGGPVQGVGGYINDFSTAASIGATRLKAAGIPADRVQMVPSRVSSRDRTYGSALALREWLQDHHVTIERINILTEDLHARRTRLLFQAAFGERITVGVISVPTPDYDSGQWWRCSEGVRAVVGESVSYLYAKFFFFPSPPPAPETSRSKTPEQS